MAITRKVLNDAAAFVAQWATVRSPANADVEDESQAASSSAAMRARQIEFDVTPRVEVVVVPYVGDNTPVTSLAAKTRTALDPTGTIKSMIDMRIRGLPPQRDQDIPDRLFVRPVFTNPMYRRLAALSVEYLVPGIGDIPNDTLGLLQANPPFVEAFMAGLNHEMGREFLWREYPARLDATWFQHFWEGGPRADADIVPIRRWQADAALGANAPNVRQAGLVLLIRSVLLRRYPALRVYAVPAAWKKDEHDNRYIRREDTGGEVKTPLFVARLTADITVFGFDLKEDEARGTTNRHINKPGYFFVLEQQPGAPRFGLDAGRPQSAGKPPRSWTDLSWSHLAEKGAPLPTFVDLWEPAWLESAGPIPSNSDEEGRAGEDTWGEDPAAMARITFQRPVRMLVHADAMLPPADAAAKDVI
jgi:hypothetical protein